jgi:hypothetical protein
VRAALHVDDPFSLSDGAVLQIERFSASTRTLPLSPALSPEYRNVSDERRKCSDVIPKGAVAT